MSNQADFSPFFGQLETALRESLARQEKAALAGDVDAMEEELERQKNLVSARNQLQALHGLWPRLVGVRKRPGKPAAAEPERHALQLAFWGQLLERALARTPRFASSTPVKRYWIWVQAGAVGLGYAYLIRSRDAQVELYIDRRDNKLANKRIFDQLKASKRQVESVFGKPLDWQRLDERRACRIRHVISEGGLRDRERWPQIQEAMVDAMVRLEKALGPEIERLEA